ncbi:unnamed protein product [Alopecurus aequalis]
MSSHKEASSMPLPMESISTGEAHEHPAVMSDPPPASHHLVAGHKAPALSAPASSYRSSSAQEPLVFPLSGPPVLVSFGVPQERGMLRSFHDDATGVNLIRLTDEFRQKRTPAQKFYLEPAKLHPRLLHIRCADGNKYLVAQQLGNELLVTATADEPEEDLTMPSCTLFNIYDAGNGCVRIQHRDTNKYVGMISLSSPEKLYLHIGDGNTSAEDVFCIFHLSDQKELPKYILIKGDNNKYLNPTRTGLKYALAVDCGTNWFQEFSGSENNDETLIYETFTDDYGLVRLKHYTSGNVCRCLKLCFGTDYIVFTVKWYNYEIDTNILEDTIYEVPDTLFKVVIKEGNKIALQSIINGKFIKMRTIDQSIYPLGADAINCYPRETTLQIELPVKSREIYDVQYRQGGTNTSNTIKISRQQVIATNGTHQTDHVTNTVEMFQKTESKWDAHLSLDIGIKGSMSVKFPFLADFGVESHFHGEYNWGETKLDSTKSTTKFEYDVPPMTKIVCTIYSRVLEVDVPFSYKVRDILINGKEAPCREMHDGIYRGVRSTDVDIKTHEEEMEP